MINRLKYLPKMSVLAFAVLGVLSPAEAAKKPFVPMTMAYSLGDIFDHLEKNREETLFCINVDTVVQHQYIGSPGWYQSRLSKLSTRLGDFFKAKRRVDEEQVILDTLIRKKCLEPNFVEQFARILSDYPCSLLGISLLGIDSVSSTLKSLKELGIELHSQAFSKQDFFLDTNTKCSESALVQEGVLFCGASEISEAMKLLFTYENKVPKNIMFLTDNPEEIKALGRECLGWGISFQGFVYYPAAESLFFYVDPYSAAVGIQEEQALTVIPDAAAQLSLDSLNQKS
ncbi:hypothetical protein [Chlamydia felis Fe/C-56]|uniref:Outer membrane protein n=1 Tax=Chlamydia felis (strain Fe/C-56) TaxID=264202 RepID=Q253R2_CHLFF|nr:DUF2608 domain-containing protein [Chlamydia felis]BAE81476.1 hypothetical protein [Chlamydia felis Fe/C-56]